MSHWYSQPVAYEPSMSHQQSPGPLQSHDAISQRAVVVSQPLARSCAHWPVPWPTTQLCPQPPQFCASVHVFTPSSLTPLQSSSRLSHVVSVSETFWQKYSHEPS